ncbi:MAG: hypothetical protein ACRD3O_07810 [Terriglobia bacterium]
MAAIERLNHGSRCLHLAAWCRKADGHCVPTTAIRHLNQVAAQRPFETRLVGTGSSAWEADFYSRMSGYTRDGLAGSAERISCRIMELSHQRRRSTRDV